MARPSLTVDEVLVILHDTPRRILTLTAGLSETRLRTAPEPGAWSISDILAHLRASDDVLGRNIKRIMAEDGPAWKRLSPRTWMKKTDYPAWEFEPAFASYREQREALLAVVDPLPADAWERTATVDEFGSTVERNALFFGDWLAGHEQVHLTQIEDVARNVRQ